MTTSSPPSHHPIRPRVLALVPGMREIGYAVALVVVPAATTRARRSRQPRPTPSVDLIVWGVRSLPRGKSAFDRVRFAQAWLDEVIRDHAVDEVRLVMPEPYHLTQAKNPSRMTLMIEGLRHVCQLSVVCHLIPRVRIRRLPAVALVSMRRRTRWAVLAVLATGHLSPLKRAIPAHDRALKGILESHGKGSSKG